MNNITEQIKERVSVFDLVGQYLKLERAGSNYKALCPFHNEKTPSFMVNPEKNFWYCFGCQKGGDVFTFVQEMEGVDFRQALEQLAERAGVEIPKYQGFDRKEKDQKKRALAIMDLAVKYYQNQIRKNSSEGHLAMEYLLKRKITKETIERFSVGYASGGWENLLEFLLSEKYSINEIAQTGLLVEKDAFSGNNKRFYDRFRDRIMFPVLDVLGSPIGFSARVMPGEDEKNAKYINTPQTLLYDKSKVLYGLFYAKNTIKKKDFVILVEGNMDVLASFSVGVENVVAISGTALTKEQAMMLKRYTNNFKICFDMDDAGQNAVKKSAKICLSQDMDVEIIILPKGFKDVNDLVMKDSVLWQSAIENSMPVMEYFFESILNKYSKEDLKGKRMIAYEFLNIIISVSDPIEKNYWLKKLSEELSVEEAVLTQALERVRLKEHQNQNQFKESEKVQKENKSRLEKLQERLLGLFSLFPSQLEKEKKEAEIFFEGKYLKIYNKIISNEVDKNNDEVTRFEAELRFSYDEKEGFSENEIDSQKEWTTICFEINKEKKKTLLGKIAKDIEKAEKIGDEEAMAVLMEEFSKMSREIEE